MSSAPIQREVLRFIARHASRPASESDFNALALRVFGFQYENNALYRRFCGIEGASPGRIGDWKRIPAMPALAFRELVLTTFPPDDRKRIFKTSGTTGPATGPSTSSGRGAHYFKTLALYDASALPPFRRQVLGAAAAGGSSFFFLMPPAAEAPHSSLSYMMDLVNRRLARGRGRFYVRGGEPRFDALAADLKSGRKRAVLLSTAFALKGFLEHLARRKTRLVLPRGSRLMETGGFKGRTRQLAKGALYRACARTLGLAETHCVSEYGMTELSSQYYSRANGPFHGPAWLRAVIVDPKTGEECPPGRTGLLKHVDLANIGSVLAVQTEDLGRSKDGGFELLGRAGGSAPRGCSLAYERFIGSPA